MHRLVGSPAIAVKMPISLSGDASSNGDYALMRMRSLSSEAREGAHIPFAGLPQWCQRRDPATCWLLAGEINQEA
jgi:hypothetical protein